ncbi:OB-fold putative lipoprotein [Clostridium estertheticum]|uniref:OB-fold protein n=1 Tax=Clostridium estertheticum TaxID=238834 RepID=UPI0013E94409|nr:hypothetical protein [Clostridium estertheticum]MBZ9685187.1 OB-fold putative lipoprotein [Clostridium estertheticum]
MTKMVNCKACNKEIAKGVNKCVHCGKDQRNFFMKHKVLTVILALVILGGIGSAMGGDKDSASTTAPATSTTTKDKPVEKKVEALKVSAADLAKAYEANEVNADKNYKDKTIETTGKIDDIGVLLGQTFITLSAEKDFAITNVQCFFDEKTEIDKIASLKKGDKVTIQGVVDGKSMNVGVNKCTLK